MDSIAGWSSPVARWVHIPKVAGSNPAPATEWGLSKPAFVQSPIIFNKCSGESLTD